MAYTREELAWAAGLFDGEGSITYGMNVHGIRSRAGYKGTPRIHIQVGQSYSPEVLHRFKTAVGVGYVTGPYKANKVAIGMRWTFVVTRFEHAQYTICLLWPWLSSVKRAAAVHALTSYRRFWSGREDPNKVRYQCGCGEVIVGPGAFGSHQRYCRPECPNGHARAEHGRLHTRRDKNASRYWVCRVCANERARRRYREVVQ
jgi:hypothetical protein